jgi:hypothetical protein
VSSPAFVIFPDDSQSGWGEMESQCSFDFISFMVKDAEQFFMYFLAICSSSENCLLNLFAH